MGSIIIDSLKFVDDIDIVPNKREPLIHQQMYKTNPPSEVININNDITPVPSHLGGFVDEDFIWNNTIFS